MKKWTERTEELFEGFKQLWTKLADDGVLWGINIWPMEEFGRGLYYSAMGQFTLVKSNLKMLKLSYSSPHLFSKMSYRQNLFHITRSHIQSQTSKIAPTTSIWRSTQNQPLVSVSPQVPVIRISRLLTSVQPAKIATFNGVGLQDQTSTLRVRVDLEGWLTYFLKRALIMYFLRIHLSLTPCL